MDMNGLDSPINVYAEEPRTEIQINATWQHNTTWPSDFCSTSANTWIEQLFEICVFVLYCVIFFVGLLGNGVVCLVVAQSPRMKTVTNYFIVNMAVGDILMTVFCVPFSFVSILVLRYWPFGGVMCKVVNYSQAVSVLVSAYTLLALSADRYMAIMRPLKPRLSKCTARLLVIAVWISALATASPIAVVSQLQQPESSWFKACQRSICSEVWWEARQSAQYTWALLALQFALPLAALVVTYARIASSVWGGRPPGEAQGDRDSRLHRSKMKMVKMMVTVVAVFTICWLPLNIFILLWTTHEEDEKFVTWPGMPYVWFACHWLAMSHSCCNPIIYCYMNTRFRKGFQKMFYWCRCIGFEKNLNSQRASVGAEGVQMSELVGVGMARRSTCSVAMGRLQRATSCSSYTCSRRRHTTPPANNQQDQCLQQNGQHTKKTSLVPSLRLGQPQLDHISAKIND